MLKCCCKRQCCKGSVEAMLHDAAEAVLKQWCRRHYWNGVAENAPPKYNQCICDKCTSSLFFLCFFFTLVPLQRRRLQVLHLFSSSTVLTRLWQKMTTNATFVVIFCFSYETRVKDNNERVLSLSSSLFPYIVENNDEPPHSSLSSVIQKKKKTQEPKWRWRGSSSSSTTQEKKPWCWFFLGC